MTAAISTQPLWLHGAAIPMQSNSPLPRDVDVLVVGAGYTGLSAATVAAHAGRRTLVLDAGALGTGCSSRNGGQVAYSIKPSLAALSARFGRDRAFAICREGHDAVAYLRLLAPQLDCDWQANGCFFGAHTPRHFSSMAREADNQTRGLEQRVSIVSKAQQPGEIASDFYHGGVVYHDDASVDPTRLLLGLRRLALDSGAAVVDRCAVNGVQRDGGRFQVSTARGVVTARDVLIATNGYSGSLSPWLQRRVIPIGSYQIATETLGVARVRSLIPQLRNIVDSRRVVVYFRPSADGERIVFGGRAALGEKNPLACVRRLKQMMTRIFPDLSSVEISHAWMGWVAYTFDTLPHLGQHEGVYYCMGYCGQGVPLAPYLGMRVGQQMLGIEAGRTAFDGLSFPTRAYYRGNPWFLGPSVLAYRMLDALGL
jgi:glycine/D-amino acid oxidase-like deaminating enzyme